MESRRNHLRKLLLGSPLAFSTLNWLSSCRKENILDSANFNGSVIIIGAGASGIYAGELLLKQGVDVKILEASSQLGGRIRSATPAGFDFLELGAEFIHGSRSLLYDLALSQGTQLLIPDEGDDLFWFENQLRTEQFMRESEALSGAGQTLFQIVESLGTYPGGEQTLLQYLEGFPIDDRLFSIANALIANDYGSGLNEIGMFALRDAEAAFTSGLEDFRYKKPIWSLFEDSCSGAISKTIVNQQVNSIDYSGPTAKVRTVNGSEYTADKILVTVPITVLQSAAIQFLPEISAEKQLAIDRIRMDAGLKIFLRFSAPFWSEGTSSIIGGNLIPEYWVNPDKQAGAQPSLTAFVAGPKAVSLASLSSDNQQEAILEELQSMFPGENPLSQLTGFYAHDWSAEPFIQGAYSYPSPGSEGQRAILSEPIMNRLFFAGEACNFNGHQGTVHGAMESAYRAVLEILKS